MRVGISANRKCTHKAYDRIFDVAHRKLVWTSLGSKSSCLESINPLVWCRSLERTRTLRANHATDLSHPEWYDNKVPSRNGRTTVGGQVLWLICNANIQFIQPKEMFGRVEHNNDADRCAENTYGILQWNFDAGGVRVEVGLAVVVSLRPRGVAFGQASSIQRDRIMIHIFAASPLSLALIKATNYLTFIGPRGGKAPVVLRYGVIISSCKHPIF